MISKKAEQILSLELKTFHSIYQNDKSNISSGFRAGSILIYPLLDNLYMPYTHITINPETEYQKEVLKSAYDNKRYVLLVPEEQYKHKMGEYIEATKFKGMTGLLAYPIMYTETEEDKEDVLLRTLFECKITSSMWERNIAIANITPVQVPLIEKNEVELEAGNLIETRFNAALNYLHPDGKAQLEDRLKALPEDSIERFSMMVHNSPMDAEDIKKVCLEPTYTERRMTFLKILSRNLNKLAIREQLSRQTMEELSKRDRQEFMRAQIKMIQNELREDNEITDEEELRDRASKKRWTKETREAFEKELRKLLRYIPNSPDYSMQYSYLDTFLNLPWGHYDNSVFSLEDVENILNRDHHALDKVKERIIEQMAIIKLRNDLKAPILCLVGPPGVGKTSLGKSVAEALGRKYVRIALGGVHDEAEIRGHRRTYLGSMPGRIIDSLIKCGSSDPVMVLDEIDKLGADYKGDPQTALLEVLDPEQNVRFHDNFIDHDYDLSKVLFIATANSLDNISQPLLDRMEVIEIEGYVENEKVDIAIKHLIPRNLERHGFEPSEIHFTPEAIHEIINSYTRESGVRQLEKKIAECLRKEARLKASGKPVIETIDIETVKNMLGKPTVYPEMYENNNVPGVATGLAWTRSGGEILFIESSVSPGKDSKLTLTGNLGDVMKESALLALQYIKAHATNYNLTAENINNQQVHIHVPEGAVPKDGPSAGITMLTSLLSAFTGRPVRDKLAMTGELTLRGIILPVGGIKEKILAAKRAGITDIILSRQNEKDILEIPSDYIEGLRFHFVDAVDEMLSIAFPDS